MFAAYGSEPTSSYVVHPSALHSTESLRRPSLSPQQARSAPRRQRTPIQHHQHHNAARSRSQSRSEALMSYVTNQMNSQAFDLHAQQPSLTVVPSQSAPTTPQILPGLSSFSGVQNTTQLPVTTVQEYFSGSLTAPHLHQMPEYGFQPTPAFPEYYSLSRTTPIAGTMSGLHGQEDYMSSEIEHGPDGFDTGSDHMSLIGSLPTTLASSGADFEIMPSRPKPQCWEHGCNGRQFSTFSNLLRHQREKSGSAMKAICPYCGTEFTRTTARNGHMYGGKCKGRSDEGSVISESGGEKDN